jgi:hypothetical protein
MRPGIKVRPPPEIRVADVATGSAMLATDIVLITFPTTKTFDGADSLSEVPLKMRTFSMITADRIECRPILCHHCINIKQGDLP